MREYENNITTNNNNSENNIALSIATLIITWTSTLASLMKSTSCHFLNFWKPWPSSRFNWISPSGKTSRVAHLSSLSGSLDQTFTNIFNIFFLYVHFRVLSITIPSFGGTEGLTIFQEARLALTYKRQSYRRTGSVLVWRSTISSDLLSSTSRSALSTPWSLIGNTATPHWVVKRGGPWLAEQLPYSATATWKGSMLRLRTGPPKQESVSLPTKEKIATTVTPELGLVQKGILMTPTRVVTKQ